MKPIQTVIAPPMLVTLIAALAEDRVLGSASGGIPWDLRRDRDHFRDVTEGRWLVVGRRTYEEMEGWFGERTAIVLTRNQVFRTRRVSDRIANSSAAALDLARRNGVEELFVCGGAEVYGAMLPHADRLVLTRIALQPGVEDPVRFPDFEAAGEWRLRHLENWPAATPGEPAARLEVHERIWKTSLARDDLLA